MQICSRLQWRNTMLCFKSDGFVSKDPTPYLPVLSLLCAWARHLKTHTQRRETIRTYARSASITAVNQKKSITLTPCTSALNILFYNQGFWATWVCPEKQSVLWKFSLHWIYFCIQDFEQRTCACPKKQSCAEISHCIEILFIIQDFWTTCTCLEKQSVSWNISLYWNILSHSGFLSNLRLTWKQSLSWKF